MKLLAILTLLLCTTLSASRTTLAQELSSLHQEKLRLADIAANRFAARFNQSRDFGTVWKEFHMSDISCTIQMNGFFSEADYRRLKFEDELLERLYVATMNYYYLRAVHEVHVGRPNGDVSEEALTPKEIQRAEERSTYLKPNGKEPDSIKDAEELILELNRFAGMYRRYTPRNVMSSRAWRAKAADLEKHIPASERVMNGQADFCIPETVKVYIVERGIFYFYFVEENGSMKVADLGIGN